MKVILRTDIVNVGKQGEIKEVAAGYARNYLVPKNLVMEATAQNFKTWEREKDKLAKQREETINSARAVAQNMEIETFTIKVKVGENGKVFGSVTTASISKLLSNSGFEVDRRCILLSENIKDIGDHEISVRIHPEVSAKIKLSVIAEDNK
ncbi:MAG: 50S ribosomal protein L9 [Elusimicrobiota bacterium]|jgi:large subunit ribosomal protein L9|nr:50S ribosomal protein L9 [Elusimicrobiota bacterium]